jgi:hypothetical protein
MPDSTQIAGKDVLLYIGKTEALIERVDNLADKVDVLVESMSSHNPDAHEALMAEMKVELDEVRDEVDCIKESYTGWKFWVRGVAWVIGTLAAVMVVANQLGIFHIHFIAGPN